MDTLQPILAVFVVLGLLGGTLYLLRSKGLARFNGKAFVRSGNRQMRALERLPLSPQHSLHLVSVGGKTLLIAVSPGGCTVVEGVTLESATEVPGSDR